MKKQILLPVSVLLIMAALLFAVSFGLRSTAADIAQRDQLRLMQTLLPGSEQFSEEAYDGEDDAIRAIYKAENGYVIETATRGYVDEIVMLVGVSNEGKVTGVVVRDIHETVGLGAGALTDWEFLAQFLNTKGEAEVGKDIDAITGATVTSKAVARCVNSAVGFVTGADVDSGATSWGG